MLKDGTSKTSGAHQVECFRLQLFKENLLNKDGVGTSGSSSEGSSSDETVPRVSGDTLTDQEVTDELRRSVKLQCEQNKKTALELVKLAASTKGLMDMWNIFSSEQNRSTGVTKLRKDEGAERLYWMFVDTCVFNTIPRKDWKRNHINKNLSDFIHPTNEAFAMLALENIAPDFVDLDTGQLKLDKIDKKSSECRYTKGAHDMRGRKKGWRSAGIQRYNDLVRNVYVRRKITKMRESMDTVLRNRYVNEIESAETAENDLSESSTRIECVVGLDLSAGDKELNDAVRIPDEYANIQFEMV